MRAVRGSSDARRFAGDATTLTVGRPCRRIGCGCLRGDRGDRGIDRSG
jgi:hypothetical protein